jgi:hypothetical protein
MSETPQHVLGQLSTYLDGRLSGSERRRVEAHLQSCGSCQGHADALAALRGRSTEGLTRYGGGGGIGWMRGGFIVAGIVLILVAGRFIVAHRKVTPPAKPAEVQTKVPEPVKPPPVETPAPAATPVAPVTPFAETPAAVPATSPPIQTGETPSQWKGVSSGVSEFRPVIVQTPEAWQTLWQQHTSNRMPAPPVPFVDFNQSIVVGVISGNKPTAGYAVEITGTQSLPDQVIVEYRETAPLEGSIPAQTITSPFHIRIIPKTSLPIRFQKIQ